MAASPLTPEGYIPRIADTQVERYLSVFGAVEIAGTKWCGKTWTALAHAQSVSYIDDDYALASSDPYLVTLGEQPHAIDEWQLVPAIWNAVRRSIDRTRNLRGGWILTGSSTPFLRRVEDSQPLHSGAGRIGRIRMHPMTLSETSNSTKSVSLSVLFNGEFSPAVVPDDSQELINIICHGGWPEALDLDTAQAQLIARQYLQLFCTESVPQSGRDGNVARLLIYSLARNLGQAVTRKTLVADMSEPDSLADKTGEALASLATISDYLAFFKNSYLIDEIPGWVPATRSRKRMATKPKRYLADPSLAVAQLGMDPQALMRDYQTLGLAFENLCMRDLLVYAEALPDIGFEPVRYYRDDAGLEVDAIIELADGRWAALEIKLSEDKVDDAVNSLRRLQRKLCRGDAARTREPEFMAVITGFSQYARQVDENIYVIPIRCLTA
ncbi:ATP-binding protein [Collinsella intestinalis]|uniref:ATP-binding protein n=1 Tax=Collinsella intestinalis TaxID=147207 RepID=UPI0025A3F4F8|nr:DUF4143 domain-containing protein [Collinsella intestinalis]MDM8163006.1 DUF4143 domain-containing protein [Collinsella intestinalis]